MGTIKKGAFILTVALFTIGFFANAFLTQVCIGECDGKYKGIRPTEEELKKILEDHEKWVKTVYEPAKEANPLVLPHEVVPQDGRANLCEADLKGADLGKANLLGANLRHANLSGVNLWRANLSMADLTLANLSGADLKHANLSGSNLWRANFSGMDLRVANLDSVMFELKPGALPLIPDIALAENLSLMQYKDSPHSLVELRDAFKKAGLRQQEREITYAIEHTRRQLRWKEGILGKMESTFKLILFELTSDYGMSPGRPLGILLVFVIIFSLPYGIALKAKGRTGIWQDWQKDRVLKGEGQEGPVRLSPGGLLRRIRLAFYFSLLSAFHVGWRELNVGQWIIRLQPHEYTLRGTGWTRTISGIQSLISVYLVALSVLTYFGRPFEL